jgi:DNA modification methylase
MNEYVVGNSLEELKKLQDDSVNLIYADPPYNTGRDFGDFTDSFKDMKDYAFNFLKPILVECKRVLKKDGNIILHVEPKNSHYVRFALDEVFGENNFKNEIVWCSGGNKTSSKNLARFHDTLLLYGKSKNSVFNPEYKPYDDGYADRCTVKVCSVRNLQYVTTAAHTSQPNVIPRINLRYEWNGNHLQWYVTKERMEKLHNDNRLEYNKKGIPRFKKYLSEMKGIPVRDLWTDINQIQSSEKLDYATQKPVKLLERIVKMYSNEKDIVLDPFAGSGTTGRACINQNRNYILFDINPKGKSVFEDSIITKS